MAVGIVCEFPKCLIFLVVFNVTGLVQFSSRAFPSLRSYAAMAEHQQQHGGRAGLHELRAA